MVSLQMWLKPSRGESLAATTSLLGCNLDNELGCWESKNEALHLWTITYERLGTPDALAEGLTPQCSFRERCDSGAIANRVILVPRIAIFAKPTANQALMLWQGSHFG